MVQSEDSVPQVVANSDLSVITNVLPSGDVASQERAAHSFYGGECSYLTGPQGGTTHILNVLAERLYGGYTVSFESLGHEHMFLVLLMGS